jgi:hypothetical protein
MNDDMDFYLSRCLKNWSANQKPPDGVRALLLEAASSPPVQRDRQIISVLTTVWSKFFGRDWVYAEGDWFLGPQMYSRTWSLHWETNLRLAF